MIQRNKFIHISDFRIQFIEIKCKCIVLAVFCHCRSIGVFYFSILFVFFTHIIPKQILMKYQGNIFLENFVPSRYVFEKIKKKSSCAFTRRNNKIALKSYQIWCHIFLNFFFNSTIIKKKSSIKSQSFHRNYYQNKTAKLHAFLCQF